MTPESYNSLMIRLVIEAAFIAAGGILMAGDLRAMFPSLSDKGNRRVKIGGMVLFAGALFAMVFEVIVLVAGPVLSLAVRVLVSLIGAGLAAALLYALSRVFGWVTRRVVEWAGRGILDRPHGFCPVSISGIANDYLERLYQNPPTGGSFLGGVWFDIPPSSRERFNNIFLSTASRLLSVDLPDGLRNVVAVCFLLNSTNTLEVHKGLKIGRVELVFEAGRCEVPLVAGGNVREWNYSHPQALRTVSSERVVEVARLCRGDSSGEEVVIDMLTIDVPHHLSRSPLQRITIDNSEAAEQCVLVSGITCILCL